MPNYKIPQIRKKRSGNKRKGPGAPWMSDKNQYPRLSLCRKIADELNKKLGLEPPIPLDNSLVTVYRKRIRQVMPLIKPTDKLNKPTVKQLQHWGWTGGMITPEEAFRDIMLSGGGEVQKIIDKMNELFPMQEIEPKIREWLNLLLIMHIAELSDDRERIRMCQA